MRPGREEERALGALQGGRDEAWRGEERPGREEEGRWYAGPVPCNPERGDICALASWHRACLVYAVGCFTHFDRAGIFRYSLLFSGPSDFLSLLITTCLLHACDSGASTSDFLS